MAPKKKGKKAKDDEWNEPETKSKSVAVTSLEPELPEFNKADDGEDLGGLMAVLGKSKGKKKKKKFDFGDDEDDAVAMLARLDQEAAEEVISLIYFLLLMTLHYPILHYILSLE